MSIFVKIGAIVLVTALLVNAIRYVLGKSKEK